MCIRDRHYSFVEKKDAILDLHLNFDNPTDELLVVRLNTWLKAIDRPNLLVTAIPVRKNKEEEQSFVSTTKSVTTTTYNNLTKRNDVIVIE